MPVNPVSNTKPLTSLSAKTGIGGLVSGMDVDELVAKMTTGHRQKLLKQQQSLQKLQWKQSAYRSVSTAFQEFQSKYLDVLSSTNLRSPATFKTVSASASSDAVSVSATGSAVSGRITIDSVSQLATAQQLRSGGPVSRPLTGTLSSATPGALSESDVTAVAAGLAGKSFRIRLDGHVKTITFDSTFGDTIGTSPTASALQSALQAVLNKAFGSVTGPASEPRIRVVINGDRLSLAAPGSALSVFSAGDDVETLSRLGFTPGQSDKVALSSRLEDLKLAENLTPGADGYRFKINGTEFRFSKDDTLSGVLNKINSSNAGVTLSYSSVSDTFVMTARETGAGENIVFSDETSGNFLSALGLTRSSGVSVTAGANARLTVNGQALTRSSNSFELDGLKVDLNKTFSDPVTITAKTDSSSGLETIKKFVEDYNSMISKTNGLLREDLFRDFQPLSEEQKSQMTETQIENWEKKAKSGILRGDALLRNLAAKLQTAVGGTSVNGISLASIGISSAGFRENGKLKLDEGKLKEALERRPEEVKNLFSGENGLASRLNEIITSAVKTSGPKGSRGSLVEMAGIASTRSDTENNITDRINSANKMIKTLQARLTGQEKRLWGQFTAMEKALQRLDAQGSYLMQFTSASGR